MKQPLTRRLFVLVFFFVCVARQSRTLAVFTAARSFCAALVEAKGKAIREDGRGWAGVAELSDAAQKFVDLPGSNVEAVCALLTCYASVLQDGYDELLEAVNEHKKAVSTAAAVPDAANGAAPASKADVDDDDDDGDDESWTATEFALMPNILGGIKVACNTITKTAELLQTMGGVAANPKSIDEIHDAADAMCALSDDFVLASYGSIDIAEINRLALALRGR
jgi:ribosomal protein L12E/L44/L45/RPP1/RPP2